MTFSAGTPFTATTRPLSIGELLTWVTPASAAAGDYGPASYGPANAAADYGPAPYGPANAAAAGPASDGPAPAAAGPAPYGPAVLSSSRDG